MTLAVLDARSGPLAILSFGENTLEAQRQAGRATAAVAQVEGALPLLGRAASYGIAGIDTAGAFAGDGTEADFASAYYRNGLVVQGSTPDTLDGWSFARAGTTFATVDGDLVAIAADAARLSDQGLLIERAATNLILNSADLTAASWTPSSATVTANATTAPDGSATADKLVETVANAVHTIVAGGGTAAETAYVYSHYVKASERTKVRLVENDGSGAYAVFDLATGTVTDETAPGTGAIEALAGGWYRCSIRFTTATGQTTFNCQPRILNAAGAQSYAGDGVSGLFLWGGQVETGRTPSTYIATGGTTAMRGKEIASITLETDAIDGIFVEARPGDAPASQAVLFDLISTGNRIRIRMNVVRQVSAYLNIGGAETFLDLGINEEGESIVAGAAWDASGVRFYMNGRIYGPVAVTMPIFDTLGIGAEAVSGDFALDGTIRRIAVFGTAPSVADMLAATAGGIGQAIRTIRVAAVDSSPKAHAEADLICDGVDDEVEINTAIAALALTGGTVKLADGNYLVSKTDPLPIAVDPLPQAGVTVRGAVLMTSDNVALVGESRQGTVIALADGQFCNVIRWVGDGLVNTAVRSLTIDPNVAANLTPDSTSGGTAWLENCGIKTRTTGSNFNRGITLDDIEVLKSDGLGVYLFGDDVHLRNSMLYAAVHDCAELCSGVGGSIKGCTVIVENGDFSYYGIGTDAFDDFDISDNHVVVRNGGRISAAVHRTWSGNYRGTIRGSVIRCDAGGRIDAAFQAYSYMTTITGCSVQGHADPGGWGKTRIDLNTTVLFTGNAVSDCAFVTSGDSLGTILPTSAQGQSRITANMLEGCTAPTAHAQTVFSGNSEFTFT